MKIKSESYLKNISRRWQVEVNKLTDTDRLIILSPYLTSKTAEAVLAKLKVIECEIYTIFSLHNFISGASSLKTLKKLCQIGCKVYHLPRLHAKMVIVPGKFATIGSQNLTSNGVKNKEASMIIFEKKEIDRIEQKLDIWLLQRQPITLAMIGNLENKITILKRKSSLINRELRKEINDLEHEFWKNRAEYIEQERLDREAEELKIAEQKLENELRKQRKNHLLQIVSSARQRVKKLSTNGKIDIELAKEFLRESVFWDHPKAGRMVAAPKHAERIEGSPDDWRIKFGNNSFLVGQAIWRCQVTILNFLERAELGKVIAPEKLRKELEDNVRVAVANSKGDEYQGYYSINSDYINFGTQAINICKFVNLILKTSELEEIFKVSKR